MKLIKLNDLEIGIRYINSDRLISVEFERWMDEHGVFRAGSNVMYWNGERTVAISVTEKPEDIQEMVNG